MDSFKLRNLLSGANLWSSEGPQAPIGVPSESLLVLLETW